MWAIGTRYNTQSRSSLEQAREARTKKKGDTPPPQGGGDEVSNLDPPIHTRGPILFFLTISLFSPDFGVQNFFVLAAF